MYYKKICFVFLYLVTCISVFAQLQKQVLVNETKIWQTELNDDYKNKLKSPLTAAERNTFTSHHFFEIDSNYIVKAKLVLTNSKIETAFSTSKNHVDVFYKYADVYFTLLGIIYVLPIYQSIKLMSIKKYADYLFFPFTDATNGTTTYGGGRYIDLQIPKQTSTIILNFNKAYNPYCAYSNLYDCPKVPAQNHLPIAVMAGVKYSNK